MVDVVVLVVGASVVVEVVVVVGASVVVEVVVVVGASVVVEVVVVVGASVVVEVVDVVVGAQGLGSDVSLKFVSLNVDSGVSTLNVMPADSSSVEMF